jgi:hypothetical protein
MPPVDHAALINTANSILGDLFPGNGQMKEFQVQGRTATFFFNNWEKRDHLRGSLANPVNVNCGGRVHGTWFGVYSA